MRGLFEAVPAGLSSINDNIAESSTARNRRGLIADQTLRSPLSATSGPKCVTVRALIKGGVEGLALLQQSFHGYGSATQLECCAGIMSIAGKSLVQSSFPFLDSTVVEDVYLQSNSTVKNAIDTLRGMFPDLYQPKPLDETQSEDVVAEPWTPPSHSPVNSPRRLPKRLTRSSRASRPLDDAFLRLMFPKSPVQVPTGQKPRSGQTASALPSRSEMPVHANGDVNNAFMIAKQNTQASDRGKQPVSPPGLANMPFLQDLLPQGPCPESLSTNTVAPISRDSLELSPVSCTASALCHVHLSFLCQTLLTSSAGAAHAPVCKKRPALHALHCSAV